MPSNEPKTLFKYFLIYIIPSSKKSNLNVKEITFFVILYFGFQIIKLWFCLLIYYKKKVLKYLKFGKLNIHLRDCI